VGALAVFFAGALDGCFGGAGNARCAVATFFARALGGVGVAAAHGLQLGFLLFIAQGVPFGRATRAAKADRLALELPRQIGVGGNVPRGHHRALLVDDAAVSVFVAVLGAAGQAHRQRGDGETGHQ